MDAQTKAEIALDTYLQEEITTIDLVFENMAYTPSVEAPYIRVVHRPNIKVQASLGTEGLNRISGTLFLYVSYPVGKYVGTYDARDTAGQLVALFERGTWLTYDDVTVITERSQRTGAIPGDTRYIPVVEVMWYAYVDKDTSS